MPTMATLDQQINAVEADARTEYREVVIEAARTGEIPEARVLLGILAGVGKSLDEFRKTVGNLKTRLDARRQWDEAQEQKKELTPLEQAHQEADAKYRRVKEETERQLKEAKKERDATLQRLESRRRGIQYREDEAYRILHQTAAANGSDFIRPISEQIDATRRKSGAPPKDFAQRVEARRKEIMDAFRRDNEERIAAAWRPELGDYEPGMKRSIDEELTKLLEGVETEIRRAWVQEVEAELAGLYEKLERLKSQGIGSEALDPLNCEI